MRYRSGVTVFRRYSLRKRDRERAGKPVVFIHDEAPERVRINACNILYGCVHGDSRNNGYYVKLQTSPFDVWHIMHIRVARILGTPVEIDRSDCWRTIKHFLTTVEDTDMVIDILESVFGLLPAMDEFVESYQDNYRRWYDSTGAIERLNEEFRIHDLGFEMVGEQMIEFESPFIVDEVTVPALALMGRPGFEQVEKDFLEAYEHYRHGRGPSALIEASNAYEGALKKILELRGVTLHGKEKVPALVQRLKDAGVLRSWQEEHLNGLEMVLRSNVNSVRSNLAAHSANEESERSDDYMVAYGMHLAAAAILMLIEAHSETAMPK